METQLLSPLLWIITWKSSGCYWLIQMWTLTCRLIMYVPSKYSALFTWRLTSACYLQSGNSTALIVASMRGHTEIVKLLLAVPGILVNVQTKVLHQLLLHHIFLSRIYFVFTHEIVWWTFRFVDGRYVFSQRGREISSRLPCCWRQYKRPSKCWKVMIYINSPRFTVLTFNLYVRLVQLYGADAGSQRRQRRVGEIIASVS